MPRALLFLQHFPGGAAPGRATGWWCGLWDTRRRCAWTGYSLVVRPAGFPAALRLAGLLVVRPAGWVARARHLCRPREGLQGPYAKKARTFVRALISNMAVRGGLTRFARPCGAARLLRSRSVQLAAPVVEPRSGVLIPPSGEYKRKSPYFRTSSYLEYGGEGGIVSLRSPLRGSPLTAFAVCPTGCASCRIPVGGSHPPVRRI